MPRIWLHEATRARTILESSTAASTATCALLSRSVRRRPSDLSVNSVQIGSAARGFFSSTRSRQSSNPAAPFNSKHVVAKQQIADVVETTEAPARAINPPEGSLAIIFTDIVKSTSIWEKETKAMVEAMQTHDNVIRAITVKNQGYEVKQNGDGFMIAFPTATYAVQFCLDVQEQLLDEQWPTGILRLPPGEETTDSQGHILFRGLKLRMSAHWGDPVCNWNEVIQRMDYLGPMVNRAARFIQVTEGGQIVVSEDFLLQLQDELEVVKGTTTAEHQAETCSINNSSSSSGKRRGNSNNNESTEKDHGISVDLGRLRSKPDQLKLTHQQFEVRLLGAHEFKGLEEPQNLYFIVPRSLEGRVDHWHQVTHVAGVKGNVRPAS